MGSISRPAHPAEPALISRPSAVSPASPQANFAGNFAGPVLAGPVLGGPVRRPRPRPDLNPSQALCPPAAFRLSSPAQPPPETRPEQGADFAPPAAAARVSQARSWLAAMPGPNFAAQSRRSPNPVPVPER